MENLESRVEAGIKWLNENVSGWYTRINVEKLEVYSSNNCVLAQLFDGFNSPKRKEKLGIFRCQELGFTEFDVGKLLELDEIWKEKLQKMLS